MTRANYFQRLFGIHIGDQKNIVDKITNELYDNTVKAGGSFDADDIPETPLPYGIYKITKNGTLNDTDLTVVVGNYVMYDQAAAKWVLFTTAIAD